METGNSPHGVATYSRWKYCFEFFTQMSEYFHAYIRLYWTDHSDLGAIGKIIQLVKGDDVISGNKAKCRPYQLMPPRKSMG